MIPADLRIDHVYLVSCKYLSNILHNPGPARLFDRLLVGEQRSGVDWFAEVAPSSTRRSTTLLARMWTWRCRQLSVDLNSASQRAALRDSFRRRELPPDPCASAWIRLLCRGLRRVRTAVARAI